jgi:hypothetical protein
MIEDKELPSEYVSIRAIWLKGIEECRKAISQVANIDTSSERKEWALAGPRTVVHTVDALCLSLVDYGEALIKTDVDKWRKEHYWPGHNKIWSKKKKKEKIEFAGFDEEEKETDEELSTEGKWWANFRLSRKLYEEIIQVLNKYNMLFPEQPAGYSNVIMEEINENKTHERS